MWFLNEKKCLYGLKYNKKIYLYGFKWKIDKIEQNLINDVRLEQKKHSVKIEIKN